MLSISKQVERHVKFIKLFQVGAKSNTNILGDWEKRKNKT